MKLRFLLLLFACALPALFAPLSGHGSEKQLEACVVEVCFPPSRQIGDRSVDLLGSGLYRYLIFDVYTAALYGPPEWARKQEFQPDMPGELVIEYHRSISATQFAEAASDKLKEQHGNLPQSVEGDIARFHRAYRSIKAGDRYALRYHPDEGTTLLLNGEPLITVPGSEFARYYFGIWLDANRPFSEELRERLFGARLS